jgi:hypothetical protein
LEEKIHWKAPGLPLSWPLELLGVPDAVHALKAIRRPTAALDTSFGGR